MAVEAPMNLTATAISSSRIDLTWNPILDNPNQTITVDYGTADDFTRATSVPGIGLNASYSATGLSGGTTYYFRIKNVDEVLGPSDWSNSASATTMPMPTGPVNIGRIGLGISIGL